LPLSATIEHVIEASGLTAHYRSERDGAERLENLEELINAGAAFSAEAGSGPGETEPTVEAADALPNPDPLQGFLTHASLEAGEHQAAAGADALQLMTIHSAKGLEFHSVFISGLEEGLFPHENSLTADGGLEEERRLMYVAITRARRRLYLTHAQTRMLHGQTRYNIASRFLDEIPPALVRRVNTKTAAPAIPASPRAPSFGSGFAHSPATVAGWRIGQSVTHPKFGAGVIVRFEGRGSDARVQVNFRDAGLKLLALEYARLSPV
jgi:DNA helicase-2/ATP-dependent DNA helicase PcrA